MFSTSQTPSVTVQYSYKKTKQRALREKAIILIQKMWWTYIRKRLFKLLKRTICAAEHCISYEILKRVSPLEAELLKEPTILCRVRFRFAGSNFPPFIVFKIFCNSKGHGSHYISGKNVITSTSEAAGDACKLMGYRKYYKQMLQDELNYKKYGITDEIDVATIKDYMQYISHMDETPAYFGGRHNYWRKLSLEDFPRTMIVYDIMDYAESGHMSQRLKKELPFLLLRPQNQETYRAQLLAVCRIRSPKAYPTTTILSRVEKYKTTQRRSTQARVKVAKMRKSYRAAKQKEDVSSPGSSSLSDTSSLFQDEDWEQEAIKLYDWSRTLRTEDIGEGL